MKRLLAVVIVMVLCAGAVMAQGTKLTATVPIVFAAADTVAAVLYGDTAYSEVTFLGDPGNMFMRAYNFTQMQFFLQMDKAATATYDSNLVDDTFFIALQTSFANDPGDTNWTTHTALWTCLDDSNNIVSTATWNAALASSPTVFGSYGRLRVIHRDSVEADCPTRLNKSFSKTVELIIKGY